MKLQDLKNPRFDAKRVGEVNPISGCKYQETEYITETTWLFEQFLKIKIPQYSYRVDRMERHPFFIFLNMNNRIKKTCEGCRAYEYINNVDREGEGYKNKTNMHIWYLTHTTEGLVERWVGEENWFTKHVVEAVALEEMK